MFKLLQSFPSFCFVRVSESGKQLTKTCRSVKLVQSLVVCVFQTYNYLNVNESQIHEDIVHSGLIAIDKVFVVPRHIYESRCINSFVRRNKEEYST